MTSTILTRFHTILTLNNPEKNIVENIENIVGNGNNAENLIETNLNVCVTYMLSPVVKAVLVHLVCQSVHTFIRLSIFLLSFCMTL